MHRFAEGNQFFLDRASAFERQRTNGAGLVVGPLEDFVLLQGGMPFCETVEVLGGCPNCVNGGFDHDRLCDVQRLRLICCCHVRHAEREDDPCHAGQTLHWLFPLCIDCFHYRSATSCGSRAEN